MVAAFEKAWQENYDKKSAEELIRKAAMKLVTATPPAVQPTGSRTPNDTIDDNSTESIIEVVNEVIDGNDVPIKVKARAQRSILWNVNVMKAIRDRIGQRVSALCQIPVTGKACGVIITTPGGSTTPIWNHLMTVHKRDYCDLKANMIPESIKASAGQSSIADFHSSPSISFPVPVMRPELQKETDFKGVLWMA
eukprot:Em0001g3503a